MNKPRVNKPVAVLLLYGLLAATAAHAAPGSKVLDRFDDAGAWSVAATDDVSARKVPDHGSLCLDFNFNGVAGYATLKRTLPLANTANFALSFRIRGQAPVNDLQMKLVDASGYNVWWKRWSKFHLTSNWQTLRAERNQIQFAWGPRKDHALAATRSIEFVIAAGSGGRGRFCLDDLTLLPLPPAAPAAAPKLTLQSDPNAWFQKLAKHAEPGLYPRGMSGQQVYWTLVGVDGGGDHSALLSEDGALELAKGGFSIEPFLLEGGHLKTWADVDITHSLANNYLPMPAVDWNAQSLRLKVAAFATGKRTNAQLIAHYTVSNRTAQSRKATLVLTVRPFEVNPPSQFLNTEGGVSPIHALHWKSGALSVNGKVRVYPLQMPTRFVASRHADGSIVAHLKKGRVQGPTQLHDDSGYASGALLYPMTLPAHASRSITLVAPLSGTFDRTRAGTHPAAWVQRQQAQTAAFWHRQLDRIQLHVPPSKQALADTLRTALADILSSRDGPALQPGTRSYARSWIRDGTMMSEALLRLGHAKAVRAYLDWYAPHQFSNGKVPCCVDARGSDPVAENDSQGELIFATAEYLRFAGDRTTVAALWPHVRRAAAYMEKLRQSQRTPAYRHGDKRMFYGLMRASISHEGYSAKPMHSYWDDFWSLLGYKDAVWLADTLGHKKAAAELARERDEFAQDLYASIKLSRAAHKIDYIPGSAELGDFDATSTTIALAPGGELSRLPEKPLHATFQRYWKHFVARRDGKLDWNDYTPYELRTIGTFVRLGWRQRVQALLDFFMADRRPAAWNQWAEVVGRDPRQPRFVGDMPHAWVASDYIRSVLDMFAWRRDSDHAMVLAGGLTADWLTGDGSGIDGLRTPWGQLGYRLWRDGDTLHLKLKATGKLPPGGFVLTWPLADHEPGATELNGQTAHWQQAQLRIRHLQANVAIKLKKAG